MAKLELHIGHHIKTVFDESGMSVAEFARRINRDRTSVYAIFERQSVDSLLLVEISKVLDHNFLLDIERFYSLSNEPSSLVLHIDNMSAETIGHLTSILNAVDILKP